MTASLPGLIIERPESRRARLVRASADSAPLLALTSILLFLIPDRLAFGPTGAAFGTTTTLGVLGLLVWTSFVLFHRSLPGTRVNPVRAIILFYLVVAVLSFGVAFRRVLAPTEANGALRGLVGVLGYLGLALVACDGVKNARSVRTVVTWMLYGGYLSAAVAALQRLAKLDYVGWWSSVPFLHTNAADSQTQILLAGRAVGTASHPIELSVACAALISLAVHESVTAESRSRQLVHRYGAGLLIVGCLVGVSRSGAIGLAIAILLTIPALPFRTRVNALALGAVFLAIVQFGVHGVLPTLRYQLMHIGTDASSRGRTNDYGAVFALYRGHPWTGIGLGTFNPKVYFFLDNAWLGTLITAGIVGVVALTAFLGTALYQAARVRRLAADPYLTGTARALGTSVLVLTVCAYFFDELSFVQTSALLFIDVGLIGALIRLTSSVGNGSPEVAATSPDGATGRQLVSRQTRARN